MSARFAPHPRNYALHRFAKREEGGTIVLGLTFFTLMVMMGGMAVDLMRFEATRTQLQQTTDRAVLAAASMRQKLDPDAVVRDYFTKAGLITNLQSVKVDQTFNAKSVEVTARSDVDPFFMRMVGINSMQAPAASKAIEKITDVEISLVLDISGSMDSNSKLTNLKNAAKEFVDTVFSGAEPNRMTLSIVPFSGQVNLGDKVSSVFNMPRIQTTSYCMELPSSTFTSTTVSQTTSFPQVSHVDPFQGTGTRAASLFFCPALAANAVMPLSDDTAALKARINGLDADGNTSIDIGMKWGTTLLDPASQGIVTSLIGNNTVSSRFAGRPLNKADHDVLKVIVLMTDGENTEQTAMKDPYRTGQSNIYKRTSDGKLASYYDRPSTTSDYYSPDTNAWTTKPFNISTGYTQLTWQEVWAYASLQYVAWNLEARPQGQANNSTWMNNFRTASSGTVKDTRLQQICAAAKAQDIQVFGIAFEAPTNGQNQIRNCATSTGHYYDVNGLQISTAFRSIASQIANLRLTQ